MRTQRECDRTEGRENESDQVTFGFSLASDWLKKSASFLDEMLTQIAEDAQLKIAPCYIKKSSQLTNNIDE